MAYILPRLDRLTWANLKLSLQEPDYKTAAVYIRCTHKDANHGHSLHIYMNKSQDYIIVSYNREFEEVNLASPDMIEQISTILSRFNFNPERVFTRYHRSRDQSNE